jgi:hypothetical protein
MRIENLDLHILGRVRVLVCCQLEALMFSELMAEQ